MNQLDHPFKSIENKVGYVFPMVISSKFHIEQYRDDDHREDALHFMIRTFGYGMKYTKE